MTTTTPTELLWLALTFGGVAGFVYCCIQAHEAMSFFFSNLRARRPHIGKPLGDEEEVFWAIPTPEGIRKTAQANKRLDYIIRRRYRALRDPELELDGDLAYRWHVRAVCCFTLSVLGSLVNTIAGGA